MEHYSNAWNILMVGINKKKKKKKKKKIMVVPKELTNRNTILHLQKRGFLSDLDFNF